MTTDHFYRMPNQSMNVRSPKSTFSGDDDDLSSPYEDSELSDSDPAADLGITYHLVRITPCEKFTVEQLIQHVAEKFEYYLICEETKPKVHYHMVLGDPTLEDIEEVRDYVKNWIKNFWYQANGKLPRGFGNKQYNFEIVEDLDKACSYCLKDRVNKWFGGFTEEYINMRLNESYPKRSPVNFKSEFNVLWDQFEDIDSFMEGYALLCSKYKRMTNYHHAYNYALSAEAALYPDRVRFHVKNYLDKI